METQEGVMGCMFMQNAHKYAAAKNRLAAILKHF